MGVSIYYSGRFNKNAILSDLITEVKEIAETFQWKYEVYQEAFPADTNENEPHDGKIYGIDFTPLECETISICFLSNYRMSCYANLKFYGLSEIPHERDYLYMLSTKTQFCGTAIHKTIIELFHYLNNKNYFTEFKLKDDGEYWKTRDEQLLDQKFMENGKLIDDFSLALETTPHKPEEDYEQYFERIIKIIADRNKNKENPNA